MYTFHATNIDLAHNVASLLNAIRQLAPGPSALRADYVLLA